MKYRIRPSYLEQDSSHRWQLHDWHRGQWCIASYHDTREEASLHARIKYPNGECVDPELVKAMPETVDE